jgi:hypothetical protein
MSELLRTEESRELETVRRELEQLTWTRKARSLSLTEQRRWDALCRIEARLLGVKTF